MIDIAAARKRFDCHVRVREGDVPAEIQKDHTQAFDELVALRDQLNDTTVHPHKPPEN